MTTLYKLYDCQGVLLYVGQTGDIKKRMADHACTKSWWPDVAKTWTGQFDSRQAAVVAERFAIHHEKPLYNLPQKPIGQRRQQIPIGFHPEVAEELRHRGETGPESIGAIVRRYVDEGMERDAKRGRTAS